MAQFQSGTYSRMVDGVSWSMVFGEGGAVAITSADGELAVQATYSVMGDQITFRDESGPGACLGDDIQVGTYTWNVDGKLLTFIKVEDNCEGRVQGLTSQGWEAE